ncbi:MAG: hypothetical protein EZS28_029888, partial [Streblomastix strix]
QKEIVSSFPYQVGYMEETDVQYLLMDMAVCKVEFVQMDSNHYSAVIMFATVEASAANLQNQVNCSGSDLITAVIEV